MMLKSALKNAGKVVASAVVYYIGFLLGSMVAGVMGLEAPPLPAGTDAQTLGMYQLAVSLIFALTLAAIAHWLVGDFLARWLTLALFSWVAYGLNTYLEAAIFTTYGAASAYTLVMQALAAVLCSAVIAWAFPPTKEDRSAKAFHSYLHGHPPGQWIWRLLAAWVAFPLIYLIFGWLVQPFIIEFYRQQMAGLTLPGWWQILPTQALRSLLFLATCLPLIALWRGSRQRLFILLGGALFIFVGGLYMLQAYWYPVTMRIAHSLEILADSFVYAGVLVTLLTTRESSP